MKFSREKYFVLFYLAMLTSLLPMVATAQTASKQINKQYQSWWSINNTIRLSKSWGLITDLHIKRNHFLADPAFYFGRWGVHYWLKENITATVGFAQMWVAPSVEGWKHYAQEHRIYRNVAVSRSEVARNAAKPYSESDRGIWALAMAGPVLSQQKCVAQAARAKKTNR